MKKKFHAYTAAVMSSAAPAETSVAAKKATNAADTDAMAAAKKKTAKLQITAGATLSTSS